MHRDACTRAIVYSLLFVDPFAGRTRQKELKKKKNENDKDE